MNTKWIIIFLTLLIGPSMVFASDNISQPIISTMDIVKMVSSLFLVIALVVFFSFFLKKINGFASNGNMINVVSSQNVGVKEKIMIIKVGDENLLIGVTTGGINLIKQVEVDETKLDKSPSTSFINTFKKCLDKDMTE